jgi:hypothetical protein
MPRPMTKYRKRSDAEWFRTCDRLEKQRDLLRLALSRLKASVDIAVDLAGAEAALAETK